MISGGWGAEAGSCAGKNPLKTKSAKAVPLSVQTARHDGSDNVWRIITRSWALLVLYHVPSEGGFTAYCVIIRTQYCGYGFKKRYIYCIIGPS